jgi:two-component system cell cycle sensor histidine kinase/response regulator CckA
MPETPSREGSPPARLDRLAARLIELLLPAQDRPAAAGGPSAGGRYVRVAAVVAVASIVAFGLSLPLTGVPSALWLPYVAAVLATTGVVVGGIVLPRPGSWLAVAGAVTAAVSIVLLDLAVSRYYHLATLVFVVVVLIDALIQGLRASLSMVVIGTAVMPYIASPAASPTVADFVFAFLYLSTLTGMVWAYRELQARGASALARSQARYRDLVERMPGVVYEAGPGIEGAWTYMSPRIEQVLGFSPDRFTDEPGFWWSRIHPDDRDKVAAQEAELEARAGADRSATEYRMIDALGGVRWISDEATLRRDSTEPLVTWSGILIDVTAEKELEARLRQAQRMEAVGQLAGGIAHDFNNLLTVIRGYGALIRGDAAARNADTTDADELIRATDRASSLIGQLLTFSRRQVLQPRVLDPAGVVDELTPMLRRLLGDHVTLTTTAPRDPVHVLIDRSQLEQVIVNLAVNARDAMPSGGDLSIVVERVPQADGDGPGLARISVTDTGVGMGEAVRSQIFEPFFTTKALGSGTGLGLPTVLGIVNEAGGRIACESAPGRGTTFGIELPAVEAPEAAPDAPPDGPAPGGLGRVLLVEDQPAVRQVTSRMLSSLGYEVVEAGDGIEALLQLERGAAPALLVSDVTMPGMLGPELARRAVDRRPGLPVLLITGYVGAGRAAVDGGPFPVLRKPFDVGTLARAVRAAIDGAAVAE